MLNNLSDTSICKEKSRTGGKPMRDTVIDRCSLFAMPDNVGLNRRLNRQQ